MTSLNKLSIKLYRPENTHNWSGLVNLCGTVYADRVKLHTVYKELTSPSLIKKNFNCMSFWIMLIKNENEKDLVKNSE